MKKCTILFSTCIIVLILSAFAPKKQIQQTNKPQTKHGNNSTIKTKVATNPVSQTNNAVLSFDSIIKNMNSLIIPENIHGYWKYDKTMEFRKGQEYEYTRQYYKLDDDGNIVSQSQSPSAEVNLNEMKQMEQIKAMEMGRTQITQEDLIIVYDANVSYFFWNQGNGKQQFVIQKIKNNNVTYLTTLDTKYSLLKDVKSGKYNLTLSCPDNGNMKSFLVLSITEDQMVLADLEYKEIQFFNKTTR